MVILRQKLFVLFEWCQCGNDSDINWIGSGKLGGGGQRTYISVETKSTGTVLTEKKKSIVDR